MGAGIDFSALNLRIKAPDTRETITRLEHVDGLVIGITESNKRLQFSIDQFSEAFIKAGGDSVQTMNLLSRSVNSVDRDMQNAARSADALETRGARATQGISRGFEMVARTGNLTGRSLDAVLSNVSQLALGFGSKGLLIGAVGIATAAIIEMFNRTRKELEKTQVEFNQRLTEMAHGTNVEGIGGRFGSATMLFSGDPYAQRNPNETDIAFTGRQGGILGLQALKAKLTAQLPAMQRSRTGEMYRPDSDAGNQLRDLNTLLDSMTSRYKQAMDVLNAITKTKVDEVTEGLKLKLEKETNRWNTHPEMPGGAESDLAFKLRGLRAGGPQTVGRYGTRREELDILSQIYAKEVQTAATETARTSAMAKLKQTLKEIDDLGSDRIPKSGLKVRKIVPTPTQREAAETVKMFNEIGRQAGEQMAATLGRTFSDGFTALFARGGGGKNMFKAMTASLLEGIGEMFMTIGEKFLAGLSLIATIKNAIESFLPEVGIPGAIALIALGAALKGAGGRVSASSSSGGGRGGYYAAAPLGGTILVNPSGPSSVSSVAGMQARPQINLYATIFGKHDSGAQRELLDMIDLAQRRKT